MPQVMPAVGAKLNYVGEIKGEFGDDVLNSPVAMALDLSKNMYIVDQGNNRVVKLKSDQTFDEENGGYGLGIHGLNRPMSIESDGGVAFFILDQGNNRIVRTDYDLIFSDEVRFSSNPDLQLIGKVADIAYSRFGYMYLVDPDNLKVIVLNKDYSREQELFPAGGFVRCTLASIGDDGKIYVYDRDRDAIYVFDGFGNNDGVIELEDTGILGDFAVSGSQIIATDKERNEIVVYDLEGNRILQTGSFGTGKLNFSGPTGITLGGNNRIYVCDTGNNRIVIYEFAAPLP